MPSSSDRWAEVDALFADVLARPASERDAYLDASTTGDPDLRAEVRALLASLEAIDAQLDEVAGDLVPLDTADLAAMPLNSAALAPALGDEAGSTAADALAQVLGRSSAPSVAPGTRLGPWSIVREIGRGGMGAVWLAERADADFERQVAIKLVRGTRDSEAWRRRFLAERRLLAALEHPHIARLYDTGTTSDGRPYLVMEFVDGTRLDVHADTKRLDLAARVRLLLAVCDAVRYAHQRLIVHRDLKPANVLVTARGEVKLLDFGIATLLDAGDGAGRTADDDGGERTADERQALTPEYASPEQVRGEFVGATSDVYSLGVMLHELLTGVRPSWQRLVRERASTADIAAALVPPSRTVRTHGTTDERIRIAVARSTSPERLARALDGDLDAIVLGALAPDPARRYPSVEALRDDLQRWLDRRPIALRRASPTYRALRFVQRNPTLVALGATAALLAVGVVSSIVVQSRRVAAERDVAERERARAEQVAAFVTGLFESADPFGSLDPDTVRAGQLLDLGAQRLDRELAARPDVQAEMQTVLGGIYYNLNRSEQARVLLERAVATRRADPRTPPQALAQTLSRLGEVLRAESRYEPAEAALREALALQEAAGPAGAARLPIVLGDLGRLFNETNRFDSARVLYDRALDLVRAQARPDTAQLAQLLGDRGWLATRMGEDSLALELAQQSLVLQRASIGDRHPNTLLTIGNVAYMLDQTGRTAEAVALQREAVAGLEARLGPMHGAVATALMNLANALSRSGAGDDAVAAAEWAATIERTRVAGPHPDLARKLSVLASLYETAGRVTDAERTYVESHAMHEATLGAGDPGTAITLGRLGGLRCRADASDPSRARGLADQRRAVAVLDRVFPPPHPQRIARRLGLGSCLARTGQLDSAAALIGDMATLALSAHPPGAPIVGMTLRDWRAVQVRRGDSTAIAQIDRLADSLGVALPR